MNLKYIATVFFSLLHELGHAICIIIIAKLTKKYTPVHKPLIVFGDQKGEFLFTIKLLGIMVHICQNDSSDKCNPITLSCYYSQFGKCGIRACAIAGCVAEFIDFLVLLSVFVLSIIKLAIDSCVICIIPIVLSAVLSILRTYYLSLNFKKNEKGEFPKDIVYFKSPNAIDKNITNAEYYSFWSRLSF